jgi:rod shape-determining protein MreD
MKMWIKYPLMFVALVLVQVLLFNQIHLGGFLNPYIYVLFILLLPVSMPQYQVLLLSFLIGITVDWFSNTMGLHAAATVLMGFVRLPVMKMFTLRENEQTDYPGLKQTGFKWFLIYVSVLVVTHHLFLFYTEVFSFDNFFRTLLRSVLSSAFTILIVLVSQYIVFRK